MYCPPAVDYSWLRRSSEKRTTKGSAAVIDRRSRSSATTYNVPARSNSFSIGGRTRMESRDPAEVIRPRLARDEALLWSGKPGKGIRLAASDIFAIPFSLLWGGF